MGDRKFGRFTPGIYCDPVPATEDVAQEATAVVVDAKGVQFELAAIPEQLFGPAPFSLGSYATAALAITAGACPHPGDRLLVVFAGAGTGSPWVLGWWR